MRNQAVCFSESQTGKAANQNAGQNSASKASGNRSLSSRGTMEKGRPSLLACPSPSPSPRSCLTGRGNPSAPNYVGSHPANRSANRAGLSLLCLAAILLAGCASTKSKPEAEKVHQRGWIGGEFKLARKFSAWNVIFGTRDEFIATLPHGLESSNRAGILITAVSSNAPARQAGLCEGDLILELNRQPVTTLKAFRQIVDRAEPGTSLPIAAWRDGKTFECNVAVGRETFKNWGAIRMGFGFPNLSYLGPLDLWPDPGFDLGVLGFERTPEDRKEIGSAEEIYFRACDNKHTPSDQDWNTWLAIFSVARGKNILSQESVPARGTSPAPPGAGNQ